MGQDIKYIICAKTIEVPINIIHFKENNALVFPVLIEDNEFQDLSDNIHKSPDNAHEFFERMLYGGFHLEYPTRNLIEFLMRTGIQSFAFVPNREILDLIHNIGMPVVYLDDKLIPTTANQHVDEIHSMINANVSAAEMMNNEEKYWSYEDAEFYYLNALKNAQTS